MLFQLFACLLLSLAFNVLVFIVMFVDAAVAVAAPFNVVHFAAAATVAGVVGCCCFGVVMGVMGAGDGPLVAGCPLPWVIDACWGRNQAQKNGLDVDAVAAVVAVDEETYVASTTTTTHLVENVDVPREGAQIMVVMPGGNRGEINGCGKGSDPKRFHQCLHPLR